PQTLREAAQLSFVTYVKGARLAGEDGRHLCQSYAQAFAPESDALRDKIEHGLHRAYTRLFMTPRSHRENGLPRAGACARARLPAPFIRAPVEVARRLVPAIDRVFDKRARSRTRRWFTRHMCERNAESLRAARCPRQTLPRRHRV